MKALKNLLNRTNSESHRDSHHRVTPHVPDSPAHVSPQRTFEEKQDVQPEVAE